MNTAPCKAPTIRIDDSHCDHKGLYPESAPENFYILAQKTEAPTIKNSRVLDWMKTLHPEHPAYTRGATHANDPAFR